VGLYWVKGVKFISAEYLLFLIIATKGLVDWIKKYKTYGK
jgi:nicotinamide riboside transporter PnuC